jgi:hypothetical protein
MGEFYHSRKGHNKASERQWEQTRLIVSAVINTVSKKKIKPQDIVELSFDREHETARAEFIKENQPTEEHKEWMKRKGLL